MNRIARSLSVFLSFGLILAAPGLAPYQAAAQTIGVRAIPASAGVGAAGAAVNGVGAASFALPAPSLGSALAPSLSPALAPAPLLSAPAAAAVVAAPAAAAAAAVSPVAVKAASLAPAPAKAAATPAVAALVSGSAALGAAAKSSSPDAPRVALDGLFEGSAARPDALAVSARSAASDSPRLEPSSARTPSAGPRWVKTFQEPGSDAPKSSVKRTLSVGLLAAVVPLALTMVTVTIAQLLGYQLHPNYSGPAGAAGMSILQALAVWVGAAVMAPVSEEAIFRGAMQGRLAKIAAKLHLGSFVLPAVLTSLIFVALHETADPVLFATRFVHAMILSYVYHKEGILASMAAHGFFNGLLAVSIVAGAVGLPWLALLAVPAALIYALKAAKFLRSQKGEVASGAVVPKTMSGPLALAFAALLMLGYFFIMPNIFWPIGAVALLINGISKLRKA